MARAKRKQHHLTHHAASRHHSTRSTGEEAADRMFSSGREQIGRMQREARSAFDIFSGPMARIMDQNWFLFQRTVQTMQHESLRLLNRRLEHASQIIENSREAQGISGLMHLQQEWLLDCARDCSEHATRFAQLIHELAVDSAERFTETSSAIEREIEDEEEEIEDDVRRAAA